MKKESGKSYKLGLFIMLGLVIFILTVYYVGKQRNLFGSTIRLNSKFKTVSGLKVGNNVRFSGINVGTVTEIEILSDTTVLVEFVIQKEVQKFVKSTATTSIGSDGLMGEKVLTINPSSLNGTSIRENNQLVSNNPIEMEDVMRSIKNSVDNAGIITQQLAQFSTKMNSGGGILTKLITDQEFSNSLQKTMVNLENSSGQFSKFTYKMNSGKGALSKLVSDTNFGKALDSTLTNLKTGTQNLSEDAKAVQSNFLLKGYFRKKRKAALNNEAAIKKAQKENKFKPTIPVPKPTKDSTLH